MAKAHFKKTYIREWRQKRGISLRRLADRLELDGPHETLSHASIGRIENGEQPYSQPILEAIAAALDVEPVHLLTIDPNKDGDVVDLVRHLDEAKRKLAIDFLRVLNQQDGTNG